VFAVAAGLGLANPGGAKPLAYGLSYAPDPTSLTEVSYAGGGSDFAELKAAEIAGLADLAVEVVVVDIRPSRLNTANGGFPTGAEIDENTLIGLSIVTDVEVELVKTVGNRGRGRDFRMRKGDRFIVTVGGGTIVTDLDQAQATAIGAMEVETISEDPEHVHTEGESHPPDEEIETPWVGILEEFIWGSAPGEAMTEGDRFVVLLTDFEIPGFAESHRLQYWSPTHPSGIFRENQGKGKRKGQSRWVADLTGEEVDLEAIGQIVGG